MNANDLRWCRGTWCGWYILNEPRFKVLVNRAITAWHECKEKHERKRGARGAVDDNSVIGAELWAACSRARTRNSAESNAWVYKGMLDSQLYHWKSHFRQRNTSLCVVTGDRLRDDQEGKALQKIASFFQLDGNRGGGSSCSSRGSYSGEQSPWYMAAGSGGGGGGSHHHREHRTTLSPLLREKLVSFYSSSNETFRAAAANGGWFGQCF